MFDSIPVVSVITPMRIKCVNIYHTHSVISKLYINISYRFSRNVVNTRVCEFVISSMILSQIILNISFGKSSGDVRVNNRSSFKFSTFFPDISLIAVFALLYCSILIT